MDDEIKVYTEEDHFNYAIPEIRELAIMLHERIMELEGMECTPVKHYMGYKYQKKVVADIEIQKKQFKLRINLKKGMLQDHRACFGICQKLGIWGWGIMKL